MEKSWMYSISSRSVGKSPSLSNMHNLVHVKCMTKAQQVLFQLKIITNQSFYLICLTFYMKIAFPPLLIILNKEVIIFTIALTEEEQLLNDIFLFHFFLWLQVCWYKYFTKYLLGINLNFINEYVNFYYKYLYSIHKEVVT